MKFSAKVKFFISMLTVLLLACRDHNADSPFVPNEPSSFSASPIEVNRINYILSLGWINPVGHTIPTDHIYFFYPHASFDPPLPVFAPGGGVVMKILHVPVSGFDESKIWIRMNDHFVYYLDHVVVDQNIGEGSLISSGQKIGTTGLGTSIDMGSIDESTSLQFANVARYGWETIHCVKPLRFFENSLQTQLYPLVDREGVDKDGRIDIDVAGSVAGNWFLDGSVFYTDGPDGWDKELSFAYDIQHPAKTLISIGGVLGLTGKWAIPVNTPNPASVTVAQGKVAYPLWSPFDPVQRGIMIVQLLDETHLKVQVFPDVLTDDAEFDSGAKVYAR